MTNTVGFLKQLLDTAGPSGFELAPGRTWRDEVAKFADDVRVDVHGNSVAALNGKGKPRLMFAGHIDEIGIQITHIDEDGFLYFSGIGGWDSRCWSGSVSDPQPRGSGARRRREESDPPAEEGGAGSRDEGDRFVDRHRRRESRRGCRRVRIGDPGVLDSRVEEYPNGRIVSRSLDNRIGAYVAAEALRRLATKPPKHAAVFAVASTREEIAWTGSGARTSAVGSSRTSRSWWTSRMRRLPRRRQEALGDHKLGGGVVLSRGSSVSPVVFDLLVECADQAKIAYTIQAAPRDTGTDADAIYNAMRGIATGLVSVPNRYMHSPNEMVALADLDRAADLLAAFARRLEPGMDFIPR